MAVVQGQFWTEVFLQSDGTPYTGVQVYHYAAGTSTAKTIWQDSAMAIAGPQPIIGDSRGRISFYGDGDYRFIITDRLGNILYDWDGLKLTAKAATLRGENQGISLPAATSANRGQLFATTDLSGNITAVSIQKDTAFSPLFLLGSQLVGMVEFGKGADLSSANIVTLGSDGNYFDVIGTVGITGLTAKSQGTVIWLRFTGVLTLTHAEGTFKLIGGQNYTTRVNDVLAFLSLGSGNWEECSRNGIYPVGGGGTGITSATINGVLLGQGTNAPLAVTAAGAASRLFGIDAGGGAPSFIQLTDGMIPAGLIQQAHLGKPSVGTPELKNATGSSSINVPNASFVDADYTLNDYSFFPMILNSGGDGGNGPSVLYSQAGGADPANTVARFHVKWDNSGGTGSASTGLVRWRYITSSDDPTIWVRQSSGVITAVWVADDPTPDGSAGINGGFLVKAWDLDQLDLPESALHAADARIARSGLKSQHRLYRALEVVAGGLPDDWILHNCQVVDGKLVMK